MQIRFNKKEAAKPMNKLFTLCISLFMHCAAEAKVGDVFELGGWELFQPTENSAKQYDSKKACQDELDWQKKNIEHYFTLETSKKDDDFNKNQKKQRERWKNAKCVSKHASPRFGAYCPSNGYRADIDSSEPSAQMCLENLKAMKEVNAVMWSGCKCLQIK